MRCRQVRSEIDLPNGAAIQEMPSRDKRHAASAALAVEGEAVGAFQFENQRDELCCRQHLFLA